MAGARLKVRVIPRARRNDFGPLRGDTVVVRLQAPPVEGAANRALAEFLAKRLGVRPTDVTIVSGERSRDKLVEVEGITEHELQRALPR